jgi:DNA replication protein DnaC
MSRPKLTEKKMLSAGILEEFWNLDIDQFKGNEAVTKVVHEYLDNLDNARKRGISIFFYGTNGTGKTFLGVEVLKEALRKGYSAQFTSLGGVIQALTDGWYDAEKRRRYEERIRDVDFLMIDDVGKEMRVSKNGLTEMVFDNLIRYRSFRNKPMILTTNSDIESVENVYGKSIVSLLHGKFIPIRVVGEDYRKTVLAKTVLERLRSQ